MTVARALLGQRLVRVLDGRRLSGIIVETEAYLGAADRASHTFNGRRTARNASMWLDAGHAYVYFTYGLHHCFNVVTQTPEHPTAVLVRALQPDEGVDLMARHRGRLARTSAQDRPVADACGSDRRSSPKPRSSGLLLCAGPARLCQALAIDRRLDGVDLVESDVFFVERLRQRTYASSRIVMATRIGVDYAGDWARRLLRFYLRSNPHVSKP